MILRLIHIQDVPNIFEYASDVEMTKYTVWEPHKTITDTYIFVQSVLLQYEKGDVAAFGIEVKKEKN